jgi:hypothetical protein
MKSSRLSSDIGGPVSHRTVLLSMQSGIVRKGRRHIPASAAGARASFKLVTTARLQGRCDRPQVAALERILVVAVEVPELTGKNPLLAASAGRLARLGRSARTSLAPAGAPGRSANRAQPRDRASNRDFLSLSQLCWGVRSGRRACAPPPASGPNASVCNTRPCQRRLSNPMASAIANSIPPRDRGCHDLAPEFVIAAARDRGRENPTTHSP